MKDELKPDSWLVAAGRPEQVGSPLNTPMTPASNFLLGGDRNYIRDSGVPVWEALETVIGGLEGGDALAYASGMAAAAAVFDQLPPGARLALPDDCYHGVAELAAAGARAQRWSVARIPAGDTGAWLAALESSDLVWLESPSNPLLIVADLQTICAAPRKEGCILAVDNTFATPLNQRPLALGADISMHSATKFIGGHSDLLAGLLVTRRPELLAGCRESRKVLGATPGMLEAFLALRGVRTLSLRLERAQRNAGELAAWLEQQAAVERVRYPGLRSHPNHAIAAAQLDGFGSMIAFDVKGGAAVAEAVCSHTQLIRHATSLGAVESTMERRAGYVGQEHLPPGLLRLSVGIEAVADLQEDLRQALAAASSQ
jgi:cystathionine gamma-synthase